MHPLVSSPLGSSRSVSMFQHARPVAVSASNTPAFASDELPHRTAILLPAVDSGTRTQRGIAWCSKDLQWNLLRNPLGDPEFLHQIDRLKWLKSKASTHACALITWSNASEMKSLSFRLRLQCHGLVTTRQHKTTYVSQILCDSCTRP